MVAPDAFGTDHWKFHILVDSHTAPPMCMPAQYKPSKKLLDRKASEYVAKHCTVQAYKRYYLGEKLSFAKWTRREAPYWYIVSTDNPDLVSELRLLRAYAPRVPPRTAACAFRSAAPNP